MSALAVEPVNPWVPAPESMRCGACTGPLLLTAKRSRPVTRCQDCDLVCIGEYDIRLDAERNRHPAVRAAVMRATDDDPVAHLR